MRLALAALTLLLPAALLAGPRPDPAPLACEGRELDLAALIAARRCVAPGPPAPIPAPGTALRVTIEDLPQKVAPDEPTGLTIVLQNRGRAPLVLRFPLKGLDLGMGRPARPDARGPLRFGYTPGVRVETLGTDGLPLLRDEPAALLRLMEAEEHHVEVTLPPRGRLRAPHRWRAWRDDPDPPLARIIQRADDRPKIPLAPGRYTVRATVPLAVAGGAAPIAERTVTVAARKARRPR